MKWASAIAKDLDLHQALMSLARSIEEQLEEREPNLVLVFVSPHHASEYAIIPRFFDDRYPNAVVVGCSGGSIIGGHLELEREPGISVLAGCLPDVGIEPFWLQESELTDFIEHPANWRHQILLEPEHQPIFLLFPDPFSSDGQRVLSSLEEAFPDSVIVGGLVSGGRVAGAHALFVQADTHTSGVIGVALYGDIQLDPIVAQGARPIGRSMVVTRADEHVIYELDGAPAVQVLDHLLRSLSEEERELFRRSPMVGLSTRKEGQNSGRDGFLVRNLLGVDRSTGRIGINAKVGEQQPIQFHIRDAAAAAFELESLLLQYEQRDLDSKASGAVMFSCLGRGSYFFGQRNHDLELFERLLGPMPVAGFFCNGELGPVNRRSWVHGYTTVFGLFRPRGWS